MEEIKETDEDASSIWKEFQARISDIQKRLQEIQSCPKISDEFASIRLQLTDAQKYITDSVHSMPSYDIRRSNEILDDTAKSIKTREDQLLPKAKFSFSSRSLSSKNSSSTSTMKKEQSSGIGNASSSSAPSIFNIPGSHTISGEDSKTIVISKTDIDRIVERTIGVKAQILIKECKNCKISIPALIGSVRIETCHGCHIFIGPCMTSVYLENNTNCLIQVSCHQLRIHLCQQVRMYVRVNSHPIIEDCEGMLFAPLLMTYAEMNADIQEAGLAAAQCWDNVVDFRWHKSIKSPNWDILPEEARRSDDLLSSCMLGWSLFNTSTSNDDNEL